MLFVVLGMHRSGTSVVSRMLSLLGASLGPPEDLMPPKPDNPRGFWESMAVTQLHDDVLAELGGSWAAPVFPDVGWESTPRMDPFRERVRGILESHFSGPGVSVWKDPRGSLLLPLWRTVTEIAGAVVVTREPVEVVASLRRREAIAPSRAVRLCLRYMAEAYLQVPQPLVVAHEDLTTRPDHVARLLAAHCGLPEPSAAALASIRAYIEPSGRTTDDVAIEDAMLDVVRGLHVAMCSALPEVAQAFAALSRDYLRMAAEAEFVRDRLSRYVPR